VYRSTDGTSVPDYVGIEPIDEIVPPAVRKERDQRCAHVVEDWKDTVAELECEGLITTAGLRDIGRGPFVRLTARRPRRGREL
jgi:hypothetical protein